MIKLKAFAGQALKDLAFLDYRVLAFFRICFGFILLFDLITKSTQITPFYTDRGIFSRVLAIQDLGWWSFSFHMASGTFGFQALLMAIGMLLSVCLILGYQTRLATVLLWVFFVSLQGRNYLILHSGDALIRLLLFWAMFLPLGNRASLDRMLDRRPPQPDQQEQGLLSIGTVAILMQVLFIYVCTALLKNHSDWNRDFTAVYYALSLEQFTTPFGQWLLQFPYLLTLLTIATYALELAGPLILVIPLIQRWVRWVLPAAFMGLHFSLFLTMNLGLFPWVCIVAWILFLPPRLLDEVEKLARRFVQALPENWIRTWKFWCEHLPAPFHWRKPSWIQKASAVFVSICLIGIAVWNIDRLPQVDRKIPEIVRGFVLPLRLDQYWGMFAPYPMRGDGWFVVDGVLKDGTSYDTWNHSPPAWEKPVDFFSLYRTTQWRKYLTNVWLDNSTDAIRLAFGKYVCREWNDFTPGVAGDRRLNHYSLYYMREQSVPFGETPVVKKQLLWTHDCFQQPDAKSKDLPPPIRD